MIPTGKRSYERTWDEIEEMLDEAVNERRMWQMRFEKAKKMHSRQGQIDAMRNAKALEGVVKTLKWVLGEQGIDHPLE